MADTEVTNSGNIGDTEIDLYADVVENELESVWKKMIFTYNYERFFFFRYRKLVIFMQIMMNIFNI